MIDANNYEQLRKPPIQEAILEVRFLFKSGNKPSLEALKEIINTEIYNNIDLLQTHIVINSENGDTITSKQKIGWVGKNEQATKAVQVHFDRLNVSCMNEYAGWDELMTRFTLSLNTYIERTNPDAITQISTRFINYIEIPFGQDKKIKLEEYITCLPPSPFAPNDMYYEFSGNIVIIDPASKSTIMYKQNMMPPVLSKIWKETRIMPYILDIDVLHKATYEIDKISSVIDMLKVIRNLKNTAFFNSVSNKTLEPYS